MCASRQHGLATTATRAAAPDRRFPAGRRRGRSSAVAAALPAGLQPPSPGSRHGQLRPPGRAPRPREPSCRHRAACPGRPRPMRRSRRWPRRVHRPRRGLPRHRRLGRPGGLVRRRAGAARRRRPRRATRSRSTVRVSDGVRLRLPTWSRQPRPTMRHVGHSLGRHSRRGALSRANGRGTPTSIGPARRLSRGSPYVLPGPRSGAPSASASPGA